MKNLKLFISAIALIFAVQITNAKQSTLNQNTTCTPEVSDTSMIEQYELINQEVDALLDFNTKNYLPTGFNAYSEKESITTAYELLNEEADAPFDFDTIDYLPQSQHVSI